MSYNLNIGLNTVQRRQESNVPQVRNPSNEQEQNIFGNAKVGTSIDCDYGFVNGRDVEGYEKEPKKTLSPNVETANINVDPTKEEFDEMQKTPDTFADFFSMIHDTYGHDLTPKEYLQVIYNVITDPNNAEVFKDFIDSNKFQKFEDACTSGEEGDLGYVTGLLDGFIEDTQGITLPKVDIY